MSAVASPTELVTDIVVPEGYVLVAVGPFDGYAHEVEMHDEAWRGIIAEPERYRVVPRALLTELAATRQRHYDEMDALQKRIRESPRFCVRVTLEAAE